MTCMMMNKSVVPGTVCSVKFLFGVVVPQGQRAIVVVGMLPWKALGLPTYGTAALENWLGHLRKAKIRIIRIGLNIKLSQAVFSWCQQYKHQVWFC